MYKLYYRIYCVTLLALCSEQCWTVSCQVVLRWICSLISQDTLLDRTQTWNTQHILICCVCLGDNSEDADEIIQCDNCGVTVHEGKLQTGFTKLLYLAYPWCWVVVNHPGPQKTWLINFLKFCEFNNKFKKLFSVVLRSKKWVTHFVNVVFSLFQFQLISDQCVSRITSAVPVFWRHSRIVSACKEPNLSDKNWTNPLYSESSPSADGQKTLFLLIWLVFTLYTMPEMLFPFSFYLHIQQQHRVRQFLSYWRGKLSYIK